MISSLTAAPIFDPPAHQSNSEATPLTFSSPNLFKILLTFKFHFGFNKIYFDNTGKSATKFVPTQGISRFPHSLRKTDKDTFVLTFNRKSEETLVWTNASKTAKMAHLIKIVSGSLLTTHNMVLIKDNYSTVEPNLSTNPYPKLEKDKHFAYAPKTNYQNSKREYIQLSVREREICSASAIYSGRLNLTFNEVISICNDITTAILKLFQANLTHVRLTPKKVLIFGPNRNCDRYHAKISDLDYLRTLNTESGSIALKYLSVKHYANLILLEASRQSLPRHAVTIRKKIAERYTYLHDIDTTIQTLALCLADIGLQVQSNLKIRSIEPMIHFWNIIRPLIGFSPPDQINSYKEFRKALNLAISADPLDYLDNPSNEKTLKRILDQLSMNYYNAKMMPLLVNLHEPELELQILPQKIQKASREDLESRIRYIYSLFLRRDSHSKIYFHYQFGYTKKYCQDGYYGEHSIRCIDDRTFIVELNRKLRTAQIEIPESAITKYVWQVTIKDKVLQAEEVVLIKDRCTQSEIPTAKLYEVEKSSPQPHLEELASYLHKTSHNLHRKFHVTKPIVYSGLEIAREDSLINSVEKLAISLVNIFSQVIELRYSLHMCGNIGLDSTIFFANGIDSQSVTGMLNTCNTIHIRGSYYRGIDFKNLSNSLLLKVLSNVKERFPEATLKDVENKYNEYFIIRTFILTETDMAESLGILLTNLIINFSYMLEKQNPEKVSELRAIAIDLCGGIDFTESKNLLNDRFMYVSECLETGVPVSFPRITLRETIDRLRVLF